MVIMTLYNNAYGSSRPHKQGGLAPPPESYMDKPKTHIHRKIRHVVVAVPQRGAQAIRVVHYHTLVRPHEHLVRKSRAYAGWHGKKHHGKVHLAALAAFTLMAIIGSIGLSNVARAFSTLTQTDWSGGVGTSTTNQYSAATNADVTTPGQISPASSTIADWCNTANCGSSMDFRKKIYIGSQLNVTDYQVRINVSYLDGMQSNFDDLRFVNATGTDAPHFIISKTDGVTAEVMVRVGTLSTGTNYIYMYYGNSGVSSVASGEATFDFFEDFTGVSLNSSKWDDQSGGTMTVSGGNLNIDSNGSGGQIWIKDDVMSRGGSTAGSVYEYAPQVQQFGTQNDCSLNTSLRYFGSNLVTDPVTDQFGFDFYCNTLTSGYNVKGSSSIGGNLLESIPGSLSDLSYGASTMRYRLGIDNSGAYNVQEYSSDGMTWTQFGSPDLRQYGNDEPFRFLFFIGAGLGTQVQVPYLYRYKVGANQTVNMSSIVESSPANGGKVATLTSAIFDTGNTGTQYGAVHITHIDDGSAAMAPMIRVWGSDNANMSGAVSGDNCTWLVDAQQIPSSDGLCSSPEGKRYYQYQIIMSTQTSTEAGFAITDVGVDFTAIDASAPTNPTTITMSRGDGGVVVPNAGWTNLGYQPSFSSNAQLPYYQWSGAADTGGSGVEAYCIYFGTDNTADPLTSKGAITDSSPYNTGGVCPYAVNTTTLDFSAINNSIDFSTPDLSSDGTYYLRIRTLDAAGNVSSETAQHEFKFDTSPPLLFAPVVPTRSVHGDRLDVDWATSINPIGAIPSDDGILFGGFSSYSGVRGVAYCISSLAGSFAGYCLGGNQDPVWYGANGASPISTNQMLTDPSSLDLIDATAGEYSIDLTNNPGIDPNGDNSIYLVVVDNAGNFTNMQSERFNFGGSKFIRFNNTAPSAPQALTASPSTSSTNSFSFGWDPPSDLVGQAAHADYCWSVNIVPDAQHCTFAGEGVEALSAGAYATQPGLNTMYVVARDEAGNIDYANRASVSFTANTSAPGAPRNLEVIDASNKASSSWKLALSWDVPTLPGSGASKYQILRSVDGISFDDIGSTTATSFVDAGLDQITYYYKITACDNANNCGLQSNTDSLMPTGRYTEAAELVAGPQVTDIKTRSVRIFWGTDRVSDTKVAYGTSSGNYFPAEAYQSAQVTAHSIELSSLSPGTTYFYKAKWTDDDGNTGKSAELRFTTAPAPIVSDVSAQDINLDRANVRLTTQGAVRAKVYYGKTTAFGAVSSINTSSELSTYSASLTGLDDGSRYFYRVNTVDSSGYEYDGSVASFTTIARPRISNVRFQTVEGEPSSTQKITWDTNVGGSSELAYGVKGGKQIEAIVGGLVTSHEVIIRGLEDDTQYVLVARSRDALGNVALSETQEFRTALDTRAPRVFDVNTEASVRGTGAEARGQIIVTWKTDEPATSQVSYGVGAGANASTKTAEDARLTTDHIVIISDLATSSVYSVQPISADKASNKATGTNQSVVVGRGSDNIFSVIFTAIQKIFGFKL